MANWKGGPGGRITLYPEPKAGHPKSLTLSEPAILARNQASLAAGVSHSDLSEYLYREVATKPAVIAAIREKIAQRRIDVEQERTAERAARKGARTDGPTVGVATGSADGGSGLRDPGARRVEGNGGVPDGPASGADAAVPAVSADAADVEPDAGAETTGAHPASGSE